VFGELSFAPTGRTADFGVNSLFLVAAEKQLLNIFPVEKCTGGEHVAGSECINLVLMAIESAPLYQFKQHGFLSMVDITIFF
jgi:hypothetical protein